MNYIPPEETTCTNEQKFKIEKLDEILADQLEAGDIIEEYHGKLATAPGENYGSTMIALEIKVSKKNGQRRSISTFCKMLPQSEILRMAFNCKITFVKEMKMYQEAVPAMLHLQQENGVPEADWVTNIFPRCYGARLGLSNALDDHAAILMEDMRKKGFAIGNRKMGLNFEEVKLVMEKIAIFHALPIAIKIEKPEVFKDVIMETGKFFVYNADDPKKAESDEALMKILTANVKKIPELAERPRLEETVLKACRDQLIMVPPKIQEPFSTLVHSDLWVNNMLLKHDEGTPKEVVFVDFQTTNHTSPCNDIVFFFYTSVSHEIRQKHFDDLIQIYHNSFCRCLKQVNVDTSPFSLDALWKELNVTAQEELFHILIMLRVLTADREGMKGDPDTAFWDEDLGGDLYKENIKHVILEFAERKWI